MTSAQASQFIKKFAIARHSKVKHHTAHPPKSRAPVSDKSD